MSRILVTGAAGFIGSHLTERLLDRGDEVVGFDNFDPYYDPALKHENLAQAKQSGRFHLIQADLRDRAAVRRALEEHTPEKVVHLAAMAGVRPSIERPHVYQEVNVGGTLNLLDAMVECGVRRLVHGSTSSVYGDSSKPPFPESDAADRPLSPYAATKRAAELLAHTYHHLHGLRITCLRFFTVYGPRQRPEMAIHRFARLMLDGQPVPMFGDGSSSRDYTYVDDIVHGILGALDRDHGFAVYNLGEQDRTTLADLIRLLGQALGAEPKIERFDDQPGDVRTTCADISAARRDLGYDPSFPLERGLAEFAAWLRRPREVTS